MRPTLHQVRVPSLPRRRRQWPTGSSAATGAWIVNGGALSFTAGNQTPFNVAATGPAGYTAGGVYGVDPLTPALPSGMTLTDAGSLTVGSAGAGSSTGVQFSYFEPGALPTLTLHPTITGTLPYMATWYPVEGAVPSGATAVSPDDATLRGSVLSAWPDGSAQVIVVAGETAVTSGVPKPIRLRPGAPSGAALTTARISSLVSGVAVNFGNGTQTLASFAAPDRIWWANESTICARYRLSCNVGVLEAVIDIHAFRAGVSNSAWVEVVIENGRVDADAATVAVDTTRNYTGATVSVNGSTIATVSSPSASMAAPNSRNAGGTCIWVGGHEPLRAWYCSAKIVGGTVTALTTAQQTAEVFGVEVTHDETSLMAHPWLFERAVASGENLQTKYAQSYDNYVPWAFCRLRMPAMSGGGDDQEIGLITYTQSDYVLNGNRYARRAVIATGLALHSADFHWRHTDGSPPTRAQVVNKNTTIGNWPSGPTNDPRWGGSTRDGSHVPNVGLIPFLCRPSPCFIECAQKEFIWHHTNYNSTDGSHSFDQARSRGWRARNMATTIFLTPDADATRKDGYRAALAANVSYSKQFLDQSWNDYRHIWETTIASPTDSNPQRARFQTGSYMHWLVALAWHSVANGKVLRGSDQTMMEAAADQIMAFPLRWINDAASYEWRAATHKQTVGVLTGSQIIPQFSNLIQEHFYNVTGSAPSAPGPWLNLDHGGTDWSQAVPQTAAGNQEYYPEHTWAVLCCAVERGVSGAEAAWTKVYGTSGNGGITNFSTWLAGFATNYPSLNRFPRNK